MNQITEESTVGGIVAQMPGLSRVFEARGFDYCCGGKKTLREACANKDVSTQDIIDQLMAAIEDNNNLQEDDVSELSLTELADHIVETHHNFLRTELPRLAAMTQRVATVHSSKDERLVKIDQHFRDLNAELTDHMMKEEKILFPIIRELDSDNGSTEFHCGSIVNPIRMMEMEHDSAGNAMEQMKVLSDCFAAPEDACGTYRAMLDGLSVLEKDLHRHIHKENNILFPKAIELEKTKLEAINV
ncbi:MAG: iron-sulfur cluster repair di-iron protein [Candidatus Lindowbacteria bacterium]|nr:iron-sulfur cluster repair di-iron protein [Candidatus Lindowbacteria bacterium]